MSNTNDSISRKEAIDEAKKWIETYNSVRGGQRERDAIKCVISGINKLPSAQPEKETCKDCKWEDSFGYGECNHCKRRFEDMWEEKR